MKQLLFLIGIAGVAFFAGCGGGSGSGSGSGNTVPTANDQPVVLDEDSFIAITLTGSDPDGADILSFFIVGDPANGVLTGTAPNVTYTPDADYFGTDNFTFAINDGTMDSNTATVSITVTDVYQWTNISLYGGFVPAIQFNPDDPTDIWLSGDDASGLYRRTGAGSDWVLQTGVPADWSTYSIVFDRTDTNIMYAPNYFGRGLLKTINGGTDWSVTGTGLPAMVDTKKVEDFAMDPTDSTILYACCAGGLYRSTDSGVNFTQVVSGTFTESVHFRSIETSTSGTDRVFVANEKGGIYMSVDSGLNWTVVNDASPTGVPVSDMAYSGNALYVAYDWGFLGKTETFTSADYTIINDASGPGDIESGMWTKIAVVPGLSAAVDRLYVGSVYKVASTKWGFFVSMDGGATFVKKDTLDGNSTFSLAVDPTDPDHVLFGSLNGDVYETANAGDVWSKISTGVLATDSFGFYEDPNDPQHIFFSSTAGLQGTSKVYETVDGGTSWVRVTALDFTNIMSFYIDSVDSRIICAGTFNNGLFRSINGSGGPWTQVLVPLEDCSLREVVPDAVDPSRLYAITDEMANASAAIDVGLYVSNDTGQSWTRRFTFGVMDVKAHPVTADEAVICLSDVYATTDSFTAVMNSLDLAAFAPAKIFAVAAFDPDTPTTLLVGTTTGELYITTNYTSAGGCTWSEITNPATDVLIVDIEIIAGVWYAACWTGDTVALPTSTPGIMRSVDSGVTWEFLDQGMYPSRLSLKMHKSHAADNRFYVGLWGGGFMRLDD